MGSSLTASVTARDIFGPPPLIKGEDRDNYQGLLARVTIAVKPADMIEEILVYEYVALVWEIIRWRRLRESFLQSQAYLGIAELLGPLIGWESARALSQNWALGQPAAQEEVNRHLYKARLTIENDVMAHVLALKLDKVVQIDNLIARAEARSNNALREIEHHHERLGAALRKAAEVEDAEYKNVTSPNDWINPLD
jgi:hypothetical protein